MVTQGAVYDLIEDGTEQAVEAGYLFAHGLTQERIREILQIRYRTADGLPQFEEDLLRATGFERIDWKSYPPGVVTDDGKETKLENVGVDDLNQTLDQVLKVAYKETYQKEESERLADRVKQLSKPARIIAAIAYRQHLHTDETKLSESFLWESFGLFSDENFEERAREDIMNELVRQGVLIKDGSNIHIRTALASLPNPEQNLPTINVTDA